MRLLLVYELFWPRVGGDEVAALDLLPRLQAMGHEVMVLCGGREEDLPALDTVHGIPVHRLGFREALAERDVAKLAAARSQALHLWREHRPDLVHVCTVGPLASIVDPGMSAHGAPLVVKLDEVLAHSEAGLDPMSRGLAKRAGAAIALSRQARDELGELVPELAGRIDLIPYGVAAPAIDPAPLPSDPPVFGIVARMIPAKGVDVGLRAFAEIRRERDCRMLVAGEGPEREALEALARRLGVEDDVRFTGWVKRNRVPALLNEISVLVMPSRAEAQGLVAIEAALMARPLIASRVGGLAEIGTALQGGELVDPESPEQIAGSMGRMLEDLGGAAARAARARERALELYDPERAAGRVNDVYERVLAAALAG